MYIRAVSAENPYFFLREIAFDISVYLIKNSTDAAETSAVLR